MRSPQKGMSSLEWNKNYLNESWRWYCILWHLIKPAKKHNCLPNGQGKCTKRIAYVLTMAIKTE